MKQFGHYLRGRKFTLLTDHASLQWLLAQKMEGLLARWALTIQEYDFYIIFCKGQHNSNTDALCHKAYSSLDVAAATMPAAKEHIQQSQKNEAAIQEICRAALKFPQCPQDGKWKQPPLQWYRQLWSQLVLTEDIVCR